MHGQAILDISDRPVPQEPMYLIINLAISTAFGAIDFGGLESLWPVHMDVRICSLDCSSCFLQETKLIPRSTLQVDYIRVYQDPARINIGCDPDDYPTVRSRSYSTGSRLLHVD